MDRTNEQDGYILASTAMLLVVLLGFVAVGVDLGVLFSARTAAQRAADAAALAGAFTFIVDPTAPQPTTHTRFMPSAPPSRVGAPIPTSARGLAPAAIPAR